MGRSLVTQDAAHKVPLCIPVVHIVYIDLHVLLMNNSTTTHRKCLREKTTACVSLFVFFRTICMRGTFPYSGEDDAITTKPNTNHIWHQHACSADGSYNPIH